MRDFDDVYHSVVETNSYSVESIPTLSTYRRMRLYQLFERATQPAEGSMAELCLESDGVMDEEFDYWSMFTGTGGQSGDIDR